MCYNFVTWFTQVTSIHGFHWIIKCNVINPRALYVLLIIISQTCEGRAHASHSDNKLSWREPLISVYGTLKFSLFSHQFTPTMQSTHKLLGVRHECSDYPSQRTLAQNEIQQHMITHWSRQACTVILVYVCSCVGDTTRMYCLAHHCTHLFRVLIDLCRGIIPLFRSKHNSVLVITVLVEFHTSLAYIT